MTCPLMLRRDPMFLPRKGSGHKVWHKQAKGLIFPQGGLEILRPNPSLFQFEGGSENQLLSRTGKSC